MNNVIDLTSYRRRKHATPEQIQKVQNSRLALKKEREDCDLQLRVERIRQSVERINQLMRELKSMEGEGKCGQ